MCLTLGIAHPAYAIVATDRMWFFGDPTGKRDAVPLGGKLFALRNGAATGGGGRFAFSALKALALRKVDASDVDAIAETLELVASRIPPDDPDWIITTASHDAQGFRCVSFGGSGGEITADSRRQPGGAALLPQWPVDIVDPTTRKRLTDRLAADLQAASWTITELLTPALRFFNDAAQVSRYTGRDVDLALLSAGPDGTVGLRWFGVTANGGDAPRTVPALQA